MHCFLMHLTINELSNIETRITYKYILKVLNKKKEINVFTFCLGRNTGQNYPNSELKYHGWEVCMNFLFCFLRWFYVSLGRLHFLPWSMAASLVPHHFNSSASSSPFPYYLRRCCGPVICRELTSAEQVWNPYDPFSPLVPLELNIQFLSISTIRSLFEKMLTSKTHHCMAHNQRGAC